MMIDNCLFRTKKSGLKPLNQETEEKVSLVEFKELQIDNKCNRDLILAISSYLQTNDVKAFSQKVTEIEQERKSEVFDMQQKMVKI